MKIETIVDECKSHKTFKSKANKISVRSYLKVIQLAITSSLTIGILILMIIGCKGPEELIRQDVFEVILGSNGGRSISLQGNSSGYQPGGEYDFNVTIRNHGSEDWDDKYCLLLIDEDGVQALLAEAIFNLPSYESFEDTITTSLPPQAVKSAYGVSLVISNGEAITGIIWAGDSKESQIHLTNNPTECSVGPLGISEFSIHRE